MSISRDSRCISQHTTDINKNILNNTFALCLFMVISSPAIGHPDKHGQQKNYLNAGGSITLRSEDMFKEGQAYVLPGTMMGGEAEAYDKGLSIDKTFLSGGLAWTKNLFFYGEIAAHQHGEEVELELETFALNYRPFSEEKWYVNAGRFASLVSPGASWHASQYNLIDAWIQADVHFGRHRSENGLRLSYEERNWQIGIEAFNGESFPSASREGEFSIYAFKDVTAGSTQLRFGTWASKAEAENRSDDRYSEGHSHSSDDIEVPSSEYSFSGDINGHGAYITAESFLFESFILLSEIEYVQQDHSGELVRGSQSVPIKYKPETFRVGLGLKKHNHIIKAQWENLILENRFESDVDAIFLADSNLHNNNIEPEKWTLAWHWYQSANLVIKMEWVHEALLDANESRDRLNLGVSGSFDLLKYF